jgi:hypothetical protein
MGMRTPNALSNDPQSVEAGRVGCVLRPRFLLKQFEHCVIKEEAPVGRPLPLMPIGRAFCKPEPNQRFGARPTHFSQHEEMVNQSRIPWSANRVLRGPQTHTR